MKKISWKKAVVYLPLPFLMAGVWWVCRARLSSFPLLLREMILVFGYGAAVVDAREKRIPNSLVGAMLAAWALVMAPQILLRVQETTPILLSSLLGGALAGLIFLTVYLISRHGLGGGDVKFMAVAGLYLGWSGVMPTMLVGSVLAALAGITLITLKKMDRKGTVALTPFLYIGIVLTAFFR